MTDRNRLLALLQGPLLQGGLRDATATFDVAGQESDADGQAFPIGCTPTGDAAAFAEVLNPFGRAQGQALALTELLEADPEAGQRDLDFLAAAVRRDLFEAGRLNFDGVFYRLVGASAEYSSPMQFGGLYLELDRELLNECRRIGPTVLFVEGSEPYIDFVSDLPADVFGWESPGVSVQEVRSLRAGLLLARDPSADIRWIGASRGSDSSETALELKHSMVGG